MGESGYRIGIDLGGTKTEAVLLDPSGDIRFRERRPTPARAYREILGTIAGLIDEARATEGGAVASIGMAIPGSVEPETGRIKNANTTALIGERLGDDLSELLGQPVAIANDANCMALSEATDGTAAGAQSVFGVILGTGVGGGIVLDGKIVEGANRLGGEWGHNAFPFRGEAGPGWRCYCGKTDCIETILSGPGLARALREESGEEASAQDIWELAASGDDPARDVTAIYVERLAMALAGIVNVLDPEVIVLGGGLSNVERLYRELPPLLDEHAFRASAVPSPLKTRIAKAKWGDSSGVRGAAWLPQPASS